jgi:hypothetical protein
VGEILNATPEWDTHDQTIDQSSRSREPEVREAVHPIVTDEAKTAQFLATKGEVLKPASAVAFLDCLVHEFITACDLLERRAQGDYTPDGHLQSFPNSTAGSPRHTRVRPASNSMRNTFAQRSPQHPRSTGGALRSKRLTNILPAEAWTTSVQMTHSGGSDH